VPLHTLALRAGESLLWADAGAAVGGVCSTFDPAQDLAQLGLNRDRRAFVQMPCPSR
jgi:hypothetical protein